jgi:hypothetical protein
LPSFDQLTPIEIQLSYHDHNKTVVQGKVLIAAKVSRNEMVSRFENTLDNLLQLQTKRIEIVVIETGVIFSEIDKFTLRFTVGSQAFKTSRFFVYFVDYNFNLSMNRVNINKDGKIIFSEVFNIIVNRDDYANSLKAQHFTFYDYFYAY